MGEAKQVLERAIECRHAAERDGWSSLYTDDVGYERLRSARLAGLEDMKEDVFTQLGLMPGTTSR